jgi:anaerobic dimethyl sulfoxide reductase subunit C (anchor subunit)
MNTHEWVLIVFTIVMQMAVGSFVILGGVHFFAARRNGIEEADKMSDRALLAIGPLVVIGLLVTFLHLGNPANAPRAISNLGSSWLSREILFSLLFGIGGAIFAFLQWRKISTAQIRNAVALIVAAIGIVLVFSMSMVYRLFSVPAWDTVTTQLTFFLTAALLGSLAIGAALVVNFWYVRRQNMDPQNVQYSMLATTLRWVSLIAIVLLGVQFLIVPLYLGALGIEGSAAAVASIGLIGQQQWLVFAARLVLLFVGAGLLAVFVYAMALSENKLRIVGNLAYMAFALVFISEVISRYLFYASMVRIGV